MVSWPVHCVCFGVCLYMYIEYIVVMGGTNGDYIQMIRIEGSIDSIKYVLDNRLIAD